MKKRIIRFILITTVFGLIIHFRGASLFFPSVTAEAVGDLNVDWGVSAGTPIFVVNNMAPGKSETRTVIVHNDATLVRPVGVRGVKTAETGALATAFNFVITHNGTDIYGGISPTGPKTLAQFFQDSQGPDGIFLSNLNASTTTSYAFTATFKPQSGNEFQSKQIIFDLKIGLSIPTPVECANMNLDGEVIYGTQKNDILKGTTKGDLIFALEGNDIIQSGGGDDCVVGGPGNDVLQGQNGSDMLIGGAGNDVLQGGAQIDSANGGFGADACEAEVKTACEI